MEETVQIMALAIFGFIFGIVFVAVHLLLRKQHWILKGLISFVSTIVIIVIAIYGFSPKKIDYADPELVPLWKAVEAVDRASMGFTPISKDSEIRIERSNGKKYDVMLHIYHHSSRTISFRKKEGGFVWTGEQELFDGPKKYSTPDGTINECIVLTYDKEKISGYPINVLNISYEGEDPRLSGRNALTLKDIQPILKEWKY
jgi:hypothetical protein